MTLREQQSVFARLVGLLILKAYELGFELTLGDAWALANHRKDSFHYRRLAIDLNLFKGGRYLQDSQDHRPLGEYWESLHPLCTWGGHFRNKSGILIPDGNHYSFGEGR